MPPIHFDGLRDYVINRNKSGSPWRLYVLDNSGSGAKYPSSGLFMTMRFVDTRWSTVPWIGGNYNLLPWDGETERQSLVIDTSNTGPSYYMWVDGDGVVRNRYDVFCDAYYSAVFRCPIILGDSPRFYWTGTAEKLYSLSSKTEKKSCQKDGLSSFSSKVTLIPPSAWKTTMCRDTPGIPAYTMFEGLPVGSTTQPSFNTVYQYLCYDEKVTDPDPDSENERMSFFLLSGIDSRTGLYSYSGLTTYQTGDFCVNTKESRFGLYRYNGAGWDDKTEAALNWLMDFPSSSPWVFSNSYSDSPIYAMMRPWIGRPQGGYLLAWGVVGGGILAAIKTNEGSAANQSIFMFNREKETKIYT